MLQPFARKFLPSATAALFASLALNASGFAQTQKTQPAKPAPATTVQPTPATKPPADPSATEFGDKPFHLESAGLSVSVPLNCTTQSNTAGSRNAVQILPKDGTWIINILTPRTSNPDTTTGEVCDQIVTEYFKAAGELYDQKPGEALDPSKLAGVKGKLLELRKPVTIGGGQADRVYFSVPGISAKDPAVVRGLTAFKNGKDQFVIFELVTTEPVFDKTKRIYETTVATAQLQDPSRINSQRADAVAAGLKVIGGLTADDYKAAIQAFPERWERRYKPAPTGADSDAKELGYRRVRTYIGPRSDLDDGRGVSSGAKQTGYIVQMDARILDQGYTYDSKATFYLSPDKTEESWRVESAVRKDKKVDTANEIGARSGVSMVVRVEGNGMPQRTIQPVFQSDGYISRVEAWLLPQLLIKAGVTTEFGFYSYQSDASGVMLRRDTLEQPSDKPGLWKLTTKLTEDKPPQTSFYNTKGELIRTELADGSVWEPVTYDKLLQLWKTKGLPIGKE